MITEFKNIYLDIIDSCETDKFFFENNHYLLITEKVICHLCIMQNQVRHLFWVLVNYLGIEGNLFSLLQVIVLRFKWCDENCCKVLHL
jgi:hypothetical protein